MAEAVGLRHIPGSARRGAPWLAGLLADVRFGFAVASTIASRAGLLEPKMNTVCCVLEPVSSERGSPPVRALLRARGGGLWCVMFCCQVLM